MFRFLALCAVLLLTTAAQIYTPITSHVLDATATSQAISTNFGTQARIMRIHAEEDIYFSLGISGSAPVASITSGSQSHFLPADTTEYFRVSPGSEIAVIRQDTTGQVWIMELSK